MRHFDASMATFRRQYGVISAVSMPVWRHSRHFDASMASYPTFRCQYGVIAVISTPVWRHIRHFDVSIQMKVNHQGGNSVPYVTGGIPPTHTPNPGTQAETRGGEGSEPDTRWRIAKRNQTVLYKGRVPIQCSFPLLSMRTQGLIKSQNDYGM